MNMQQVRTHGWILAIVGIFLLLAPRLHSAFTLHSSILGFLGAVALLTGIALLQLRQSLLRVANDFEKGRGTASAAD